MTTIVKTSPIYVTAHCYYCKRRCIVKCGHCSAGLMFFGQKHCCPDPDDGFFDDNDFDVQLCSLCDQEIGCYDEFPEIKPHNMSF